MCYESLLNGDATDSSVTELLRREMGSAFRNGLGAGAIVTAVLLWRSVAPSLLVGSAVAAVVLGALIHQLVLLAGIQLVRRRSAAASGTSTGRLTHD
jgi:sugar phosphate permease